MTILLMGVTGTGKTTIAHALVARTGWAFAEGDDYHSEANRAKMHAGIPLTDVDRAPWLEALHGVLAGWTAKSIDGVMTCSALKQSYRDTLARGLPAGAVRFVLLEVPLPELEERLANRKNHFMSPDLLASQLATLEPPADALRVRATGNPRAVADSILSSLGVPSRG